MAIDTALAQKLADLDALLARFFGPPFPSFPSPIPKGHLPKL